MTRLLLVIALWATAVGDDSLQWSDWYDSTQGKPIFHFRSLDELICDDWRNGKISYRECLDRRLHPAVVYGKLKLVVKLSGRRIIPPYTPAELLDALHVYRHLVGLWSPLRMRQSLLIQYHDDVPSIVHWMEYDDCPDGHCRWWLVDPAHIKDRW